MAGGSAGSSANRRVSIDGREIELSHLDRVMFPADGLTKGDLVEYYRRIAPMALPWCRHRPLSMQRFPEGIGEAGFYQKHAPEHFPSWVERVRLPKEDGHVDYVVANDSATLVYLANHGCITPHLALARCRRPHHPDRLVFDLDPSDDDFEKVCFAARELKRCLDVLSLESYLQTTGSRGLHVIVPLDESWDFDAVRTFARGVADALAERHPRQLTTQQRKAQRGEAVFIDTLRNAYGQTSVAPYAVRALDGAPVATPLAWEELERARLHPRRYTLRNVFRRLAQIDDPWAGMSEHTQSLAGASRRLEDGRCG